MKAQRSVAVKKLALSKTTDLPSTLDPYGFRIDYLHKYICIYIFIFIYIYTYIL